MSVTPRIVVVGSVNRRKNQSEAVQALAQVHKTQAGTRLLLIGGIEDHAYAEEIRDLADRLGVGTYLDFAGHCDDPWSLVRSSDIIVQCSENEVFSLVACEAARLGLRMILTRIPSSTDIESALGEIPLYDLGDVIELARIVADMIENPATSMEAAAVRRDIALRVLSADACHEAIMDFLSGPLPDAPRGSLTHVAPYLDSLVTDYVATAKGLTNAVRLVHELQNTAENLTETNQGLQQELSNLYSSRSWRLLRILTAPVRALRRLDRH